MKDLEMSSCTFFFSLSISLFNLVADRVSQPLAVKMCRKISRFTFMCINIVKGRKLRIYTTVGCFLLAFVSGGSPYRGSREIRETTSSSSSETEWNGVATDPIRLIALFNSPVVHCLIYSFLFLLFCFCCFFLSFFVLRLPFEIWWPSLVAMNKRTRSVWTGWHWKCVFKVNFTVRRKKEKVNRYVKFILGRGPAACLVVLLRLLVFLRVQEIASVWQASFEVTRHGSCPFRGVVVTNEKTRVEIVADPFLFVVRKWLARRSFSFFKNWKLRNETFKFSGVGPWVCVAHF